MDLEHERPVRTRRALPALAAGVCSAVLFYFGTGPAPIPALTWFAALPVLLLAPRVSGKVTAGVAFLACLLGMTNSWGWYSHSHDMPLLPWGLLVSVTYSLTFVLVVWLFRTLLGRGRALLAVTTAPAAWTGVLYLVSVLNPMGIMGTLANMQADVPLVLQTTSVTGMWGIEYLVLLVPSAIAALLAPAASTAARVRTATVTAVVLAVVLGAGALRLWNESGKEPAQRVAAIATNQRPWAPDVATPAGRDLVAAYVDQIAALPDGVKTVVLPEGSFGSYEASPAALFEPMSRVAQARGVDIVVGFARWEGKAKYNFALTFPARGGDPVSYLKHHDMVSPPGHDLVFPPTAGGRVGVEICADVDFPNPSRDYAEAGAQLLAIPASDEDANGWQHSRTALLRGVENGQAVVWSARRGTLMISDGWGRVLADAHTDGPGPFTTIVADVPTGPGATPYTRLGDWFAWLCLVLALGGPIAAYPIETMRRLQVRRVPFMS
jgi:apolipoprotein N-acyltransferase